MIKSNPLLLAILDGWGYTKEKKGNAILAANTPILDSLMKKYPTSILKTSGEAVGLPKGQMGNSEVGHLNIGAGRVIYQDLLRINREIESKKFYTNSILLDSIENVKKYNSNLHIMGLFSYGGVHSNINHLNAIIKLAKNNNINEIFIHAFLDGRDVPPKIAFEDVKNWEKSYKNSLIKIATISGRYYAMDRDKRWDRTKCVYDMLVEGTGLYAKNAESAIQESYKKNITDEFIKPTIILNKNKKKLPIIKNNDSVIFFNFRPDRARQLTYAFVKDAIDFNGFERKIHPKVHFTCMTEYDSKLNIPTAYSKIKINDTLGKVLSANNLKQLRIAETEKYAHVTFFFNGGVESPNKDEDRILIPSPHIATYDLKPEMSAYDLTDKLIEVIESKKYDVIILNYANMDMVGHTGMLDKVISAVEAVDECIGRIVNAINKEGGRMIITADHGNAEKVIDYNNNNPYIAHTTNPVKCIYVHNDKKNITLKDGVLADIAPTILDILGIDKPNNMTGKSLILKNELRDNAHSF